MHDPSMKVAAAKTRSSSKRVGTAKAPKAKTEHVLNSDCNLSELDKALERRKECQREKAKIDLEELRDFKKNLKKTFDKTKRETQILDQKLTLKRTSGKTRSGARRNAVKQQPFYSNGKWIDKGITESKEKFDETEKEYLKKSIEKLKEVKELKFEHLKYLIIDVFLGELEDVKAGKIESEFHARYYEAQGKNKSQLLADIRLGLFTNEQRDYINGLLQGAFDTDSKDDDGQIKHKEIDYVSVVMLAESTIRLVKYVHKFDSNEQAFQFTIDKARMDLGLEDDL